MLRANQLVYALRQRIYEATNSREIPELDVLYDILDRIDEYRGVVFSIPAKDFGIGGVLYDKGEGLSRHEDARKHIQRLIVQKTIGHAKVQSVEELIDLT
jgi:hypothetical protein